MFFKEGAIKAPLLSQVWSVASLDVQVLPADKNNATDRNVAAAYKYALLNLDGGFPAAASEILLPARIRGESLCNLSLRADVEPSGPYAGKRLLHAIKSKPPESYDLKIDGFNNLVGVKAALGGAVYAGEQLDEFIFYQWLSIESQPGVSDLRAALDAYNFKTAVSRLRFFFLDKMAGGFLVATGVPKNDEPLRKAMLAALDEARANGYIVVPVGVEVSVLDLAMGTDANFKSAIDDAERQMMIAVGASHLPFQEGQTNNGAGDTQVQRKVSSQTEWKMAADLSTLLTKKSKLFVEENFAGAALPTVQLGAGIDPAVINAQVDLALKVNSRAPISAEYLYEISSVPPPKNDADAIQPPAAPGAAPGLLPFADAGGELVWEEDLEPAEPTHA
jgi:hypothetical protein